MAQNLVGWKNDPFNSNPLSFSTTWSKYIVFQVKADQLTFPKTSRHHSGVYTCSADNGWGSAAQARIVLDVQVMIMKLMKVKRAIMIRLTMVNNCWISTDAQGLFENMIKNFPLSSTNQRLSRRKHSSTQSMQTTWIFWTQTKDRSF